MRLLQGNTVIFMVYGNPKFFLDFLTLIFFIVGLHRYKMNKKRNYRSIYLFSINFIRELILEKLQLVNENATKKLF
jgi:hypothetical protein